MFRIIGMFLLGCIVACLGVFVKWEFKRAKRGPRFNAKALQIKTDRSQEGTGPIFVPPGGVKRAFEHDRRRP